ncbi:recombinase RecT [Paraburkholderia tropica]|uniref:recombinase RecT n=1 Tax=Paraburkholderia tropica TaxID=92647 RepID=UPI003D2ABBA7
MSNAIATISDEIYGTRASFEAVSVDRSINFEREAGFAIQMISGNDYALTVAMNNKQSVIDAVTNVAAIGISLNPAKKQAYLVPRKSKICLDISYMGLIDLAIQDGGIKWAQAQLVYEKDAFALNGMDKLPLHQFNPFSKDRGEIVGVYVVVKTADGEYLTHTMDIDAAYAIRDRSESWKRNSAGKRGPWETDPGEMIKKTCVKQAYKYWPKTDRLNKAIHFLDTEGGEGIETVRSQQVQGCAPDVLTAWCNKAKEAASEAALQTVWEGGLAVINASGDRAAYNTFKATVKNRKDQLVKIPDDGKTIDMPATAQTGQREPGSDDDLAEDFKRQMAKEGAAR